MAASQNSGIVAAALYAIMTLPKDAPLHVVSSTDALTTILFRKRQEWEDRGWVGVPGAQYFKALVNQLRQRCAPTSFAVRDRTQDRLMEAAEKMCATASDPTAISSIRLVPPVRDDAFELSGTKLNALTQAHAYKCIREKTKRTPRAATEHQMMRVLTAARVSGRPGMTQAEVWNGVRHRDIQRKIVDFLWKALHGAHRVGHYWTKIPGYEERGMCQRCGVEDSMEHILVHCTAYGRLKVWEMAESLWARKGLPWHGVDCQWEDILGAGANADFIEGDATPKAVARLWRILITESAHLVWRLRCARVIGHGEDADWQHSPKAVETMWLRVINSRLRQDVTATHSRFGRQALHPKLVADMWKGVVQLDTAPLAEWVKRVDRHRASWSGRFSTGEPRSVFDVKTVLFRTLSGSFERSIYRPEYVRFRPFYGPPLVYDPRPHGYCFSRPLHHSFYRPENGLNRRPKCALNAPFFASHLDRHDTGIIG
ncbi:hypothetical protein FOMPIDRAFT_1130233 [Fomitopsis schrenkii]|uniref:Reverse transcriptase zinc-binding domain-containing protein n=1 Tax=Fomitopsis schrenkii TaxID=2126942 RepID=S8DZI3_FOMSC|nr:hypothetical protein FOMPIDRAFT_1130233 [Fomitopsis schrenkii]